MLCIGLISASIVAFSFFSAEKAVPSLQSADKMGLDSPYRSGIHGLKPISPEVHQDRNKLKLRIQRSEVIEKFENLVPIQTGQSTGLAVRRSLV